MKISENVLENFQISYPIDNITNPEQVLFIDIETTGFTARSSFLYLIGCAYYSAGKWCTMQWFAQNHEEERDILCAFFEFAGLYKNLIHFNGNNFDLPYIEQKCKMLSLDYNFNDFTGIDLYKRISPYKYILHLPNCKQKTIEQFLGINRLDQFTGGELIKVYEDYVKSPTGFSENALFLHNKEDLIGMLDILPILTYYDLFNIPALAKRVLANTYKDMDGAKKKELLITLSLINPVPVPFSYKSNNLYLDVKANEAILRVPVYEEELKYFYSNYKDYYYLPEEDVALHKSVATFVDKSHRIQANASNCYTRKYSEYLPEWDDLFTPFFKRDYKSNELFFELTDELKKNRKAFSEYGTYLLERISTNY